MGREGRGGIAHGVILVHLVVKGPGVVVLINPHRGFHYDVTFALVKEETDGRED